MVATNAISCFAQDGARHSFGGIVEQLSRSGQPASHPRLASEAYGDRQTTARYPSSQYGQSGTVQAGTRPGAVPLRPSAMSVRKATYETADPISSSGLMQESRALRTNLAPNLENELRRDLEQQNSERHRKSFIEREQAAEEPETASATEMISRMGINLVFVLAIAVGAILLIRNFQKGKLGTTPTDNAGLTGLKIDQVLQVARGVSLYLIDGPSSKVLVAIDSSGIKSVHVMPGDFADGLEDPEAFVGSHQASTDVPASETREPESRRHSRRKVDTTSSSEIDENLIRLLLNQSSKAA
ncbi:MAG: hypothetical protein AAFV88_04240 [Planctomycetota bacterium]